MSQPLRFYCDTPHTRQLVGLFGDRLQQMERADLLDFITVFSAACNQPDDSSHSEYALQQLVSDMNIVIGPDVDTAFEVMDGFDRGNELNLLFGLADCLADRSEGK